MRFLRTIAVLAVTVTIYGCNSATTVPAAGMGGMSGQAVQSGVNVLETLDSTEEAEGRVVVQRVFDTLYKAEQEHGRRYDSAARAKQKPEVAR